MIRKLLDINIRFREVIHLAEQILQTSREVEKLADGELFQILCTTKGAWQSESADLFCQKEVKINEQLIREAEILQKLSKELEERARAMYLAESTNSLLAKARIYL